MSQNARTEEQTFVMKDKIVTPTFKNLYISIIVAYFVPLREAVSVQMLSVASLKVSIRMVSLNMSRPLSCSILH